MTLQSDNGVFNGTASVDIVDPPEIGRIKTPLQLIIHNQDSAAAQINLYYDDNGTARKIYDLSLAAGETFVLERGLGCLDQDDRKITGVLDAEPSASNPTFVTMEDIRNFDVQ